MSALQGAVYNHALSQRVRDGTFGAVLRGDVAMLGGSSSVFPIAHDAPADELAVLESRCAAHDISAAGPIPGPGMLASSGLPVRLNFALLLPAVLKTRSSFRPRSTVLEHGDLIAS